MMRKNVKIKCIMLLKRFVNERFQLFVLQYIYNVGTQIGDHSP